MRRLRNLKWVTKSGEEIAVKDMGTKHIKNALKMLQEVTLPNLEMAMATLCDTPSLMADSDVFDVVPDIFDYEIEAMQAYEKYTEFVIAFENELELRGENSVEN